MTLRLAIAGALAAVAGWVDAVGYLQFAHVFVSFMSGNSTVLGIAIGQGMWTKALSPLIAIGCFVLGSFVGSLIGGLARDWRAPIVLSFEAILLASALGESSSGGDLAPAIAPLAGAMGAQNAAMSRVGGIAVSLTYVTGALVKLGQSLAEACLGRGERSMWIIHAIVWFALMLGGAGGAFAYTRFGFEALAGPIAGLVTLGVIEAAVILRAREDKPKRITT